MAATSLKRRFSTKLKGYDLKGTTTFIAVPADVMAAFAPRKRFPIKATVNGFTYRTTVVDMGDGPMFPVRAQVREAASVSRGDRIDVTIALDTEERTVDVPPYLAKALGARLRKKFDEMAFTHRKEYVLWVEDAKRPETRARRIELVKARLRERMEVRR